MHLSCKIYNFKCFFLLIYNPLAYPRLGIVCVGRRRLFAVWWKFQHSTACSAEVQDLIFFYGCPHKTKHKKFGE